MHQLVLVRHEIGRDLQRAGHLAAADLLQAAGVDLVTGRGTWYLQVVDAAGRRRMIASTATTKTAAKRLSMELEVRYERQRLRLEPMELEGGGGTIDELMEWWIQKFLIRAASDTGVSSIRQHIIGSPLGSTVLTDVTPGKIDFFLSGKEKALSARSVNHLLRHTTASLLLMSGADLAAVQRIMRHQDPRLTTEVYGHLSTNYLRKEIDRLSFGMPPANEAKNQLSAGGASEPPRPADTRAKERTAAPSPTAFTTRLLPDPPPEPSERPRPRMAATEFRELELVGARGFEPPTFRSRTERATRLRHAPSVKC